jgi:hypothetical protein
MNSIIAMMAEARSEAAKRIQSNKHILFDAFDVNGVTGAEVRFEGSGDSGGVESIELHNVENEDGNKILLKNIEGAKVLEGTQFSPEGIKEIYVKDPVTINDLIESIVYDALKVEHEGWENNDGAYGEFHFHSEDRVILMEYNERSIEHHEHEF